MNALPSLNIQNFKRTGSMLLDMIILPNICDDPKHRQYVQQVFKGRRHFPVTADLRYNNVIIAGLSNFWLSNRPGSPIFISIICCRINADFQGEVILGIVLARPRLGLSVFG